MDVRRWKKHWWITALGAVLCLLAAAFALEAKLGWYSPNGSIRVQLSSTKLQAADASRQVEHALAVPATVPQFPAELPLFLAFAVLIAVFFVPRLAEVPPAPAWSLFSPPHFLRPPPRS